MTSLKNDVVVGMFRSLGSCSVQYCAACVDIVSLTSRRMIVLLLSLVRTELFKFSRLLDCSVFVGWLEPLVGRIAENPANVVCPVIDTISDDTFEIQWSSYPAVGGFSWDLQVRARPSNISSTLHTWDDLTLYQLPYYFSTNELFFCFLVSSHHQRTACTYIGSHFYIYSIVRKELKGCYALFLASGRTELVDQNEQQF